MTIVDADSRCLIESSATKIKENCILHPEERFLTRECKAKGVWKGMDNDKNLALKEYLSAIFFQVKIKERPLISGVEIKYNFLMW